MQLKNTTRVVAIVLAAGATLAGTAQAKPSDPGAHPFYSTHGIVQPQKHKAKSTSTRPVRPTADGSRRPAL